MAQGFSWAYRLVSVGFQFSLPILLGYLVDRWLGSIPVATLVGAVLGFTAGMLELIRIARQASPRPPTP